MALLQSFSLPAFIQDFALGSPQDVAMKARWDINVRGWIKQAIPTPPAFFYDPTQTDIPPATPATLVDWGAFPGRLEQFFSNQPPNDPRANPYKLSGSQIYALADTGSYPDTNGTRLSFPNIPQNLCPQAEWTGKLVPFGPYGPRGWLDEYCEWSTARDQKGNLVRADFTCENPEYWHTLWKVDPNTVRALYESVLNWDAPDARHISVALTDLMLHDASGNVVIDPETASPAYNPLNKWNNGPVSQRFGAASDFTGGVMHLTSTPNTLQTELTTAGAATIQYVQGNTAPQDPQALICCGRFGQAYRHSDPHFGWAVNQIVSNSALVCLADPIGLYIQNLTNPELFKFGNAVNQVQLPEGAKASDIWQVVRGRPALVDPVTDQDFPGGFNLHVVCQIPSEWLAAQPALTLADITINSQPILYAGQIASQFCIGFCARPLPTTQTPPQTQCASGLSTPGAPQQCMYSELWKGYYAGVETAPTGMKMSLASNTTMMAPQIRVPVDQDAEVRLTLICNTPSGPPQVSIGTDSVIDVKVISSSLVEYAVPGNSYPSSYTALELVVIIPSGQQPGFRAVQVVDPVAGPSTLPAAIYLV